MKKVIIFIVIFLLIIYFLYNKYYLSGEFNKYLDKNSNSEFAQYIDFLIGKVNYMQNDYDGAIFRYNRVINNYFVEKYKLNAYFSLAQIYEELNNKKKAIEIYEYLKLYYPDTDQGRMAIKRLEYLYSF